MAENEYQRLTRSTVSGLIGISRVSLWLGNDHLLCVHMTGYSEIYKRFYFRDIEAIVVRATNARNIWTFGYAIAVFFFSIIGISINNAAVNGAAVDDTVARVIFLSLAGISALACIINLLRGPTCTCEIRTLVQTERLPLSRVRKTQKVLNRIRPLIASAQGQLTPEEVAARMVEPPLANPVPVAAPAPEAIASETLNAAPAPSLSSPNEERAGVRDLGAQAKTFPSPSAADPDAPPPAVS